MTTPQHEGKLAYDLQHLKAALKAANDELTSNKRGAAISALQGVINFINSIPEFEHECLTFPLTALMAALHDLDSWPGQSYGQARGGLAQQEAGPEFSEGYQGCVHVFYK